LYYRTSRDNYSPFVYLLNMN